VAVSAVRFTNSHGKLNPAAGFSSGDWACGTFNVRFMVSVSVQINDGDPTTVPLFLSDSIPI
jgi:hypothetical protein